MKLSAVRLFTKPEDWNATLQFYVQVLGVPVLRVDQATSVGVLQAGGVTLIIEQIDSADKEELALVGRETGISFETDNADSLCSSLERSGVPIVGRPEKQVWGGTLFHAKDPAANVIAFVQYP